MKIMPTSDSEDIQDDLQPEYRFDYQKAKPNRFMVQENQRVIILDEDVARYFKDSVAVNRILRSLIENMPQTV